MAEGYNSVVARRAAKVTQRQLDYWAELGIVSPSVQGADGRGSERLYSFQDIVKLRIVKRFRELGLSLQKVRKALRKLRKDGSDGEPLLDEVLVTDGKTLYRRLKTGQLADLLKGGQMVLSIIQLGLIQEETRVAVSRLKPGATDQSSTVSRRTAAR